MTKFHQKEIKNIIMTDKKRYKILIAGIITFFLISAFFPIQGKGAAEQQAGAAPFNFSPAQKVGEVSSRILISPEAEIVFLETSPGVGVSRFLPKAVSENYREEEFVGYIAELKEPPLLVIKVERDKILKSKITPFEESLKKAINKAEKEYIQKQINNTVQLENIITQISLLQQRILIQKEQNQVEAIIKILAPKAQIKRKFSNAFNGFSIKQISASQVQELRNRGYKVWPNYKVKAMLMDSVPLIGAKSIWENIIDPEGNPVTGRGITIGIIDTGVDYNHPDLGSCLGKTCKVIGGYDFVNNDQDPMDDHGHGTHVAAIAAGNGLLKGVAPDADIYAYKVLDSWGSGTWEGVIAGIDRAVDPNQDGNFSDHLDVINLSLGGLGNPDDPVSKAIDNTVTAGVVAVVAAGNWGPLLQSIASPGTAREAITVAASNKQDQIAYFSSRGPVVWENKSIVKPDITAPGVDICAAQWNDWLSDRRCLDDKHISISGTSMASPHIAGAVALIKQLQPNWTPRQIKYALRNTGLDIGFTPLEQGEGRVDLIKTAQLLKPPLIAKLEPIPTTKTGQLLVQGYIEAPEFDNYTLSYSPINTNNFVVLKKSTIFPENGKISYQFNLDEILDGKYILRLLLGDKSGQKSLDYGYFEVDKYQIINPLNWDILRAGDTIKLEAKISPSLKRYTLKWSYQSSDSSSWLPITGNTWQTRNLRSGVYGLKATLMHHRIVEEEGLTVYLDSTLKKGWPQRVEWEKTECFFFPGGECYYWAGFLEPVVSDINKDGKKEIIVLKGGKPPKLLVYRHNGTLLWSAKVGTGEEAGGNLHIPLVGDINNDGEKEIFVINLNIEFDTFSELYAFQSNGKPLKYWPFPVKIPRNFKPLMLMADLNFDGKKEIVIKPGLGEEREMAIISAEGKILFQWPLPNTSWFGFIDASPAIGNFDDDKELEIVVAGPSEKAGGIWENGQFKGFNNEGEVHVFNMDGSYVKGWPIKTEGIIFSSPAVGDINKDGKDEIIVGLMYASDIFPDPELGGLYVFDRNGNILPGWPQFKGYNFWSSPSLGDIDNDGDLEIGASRLGFETYLFHHDGTLVSGWPQSTSWNDYYSTIIGDVDGDQKPDLLTTAGNYWYGGGVYAWKDNGQSISGFPKATEVDAQAPAVIADIDNDGRVEVIASSDWDFDSQNNKWKLRGSLYVWDLPANYNEKTMHWPTFHRDEERTGYYPASVSPPSITVISPNGGETLTVNSQITISWQSSGSASPTVLLEVRKGLSPYIMISSAAPNTGSYPWTVVAGLGGMNDLKIRVTDQDNRDLYDESDNYFSVVSPERLEVLEIKDNRRYEITTYPGRMVAGYVNVTNKSSENVILEQVVLGNETANSFLQYFEENSIFISYGRNQSSLVDTGKEAENGYRIFNIVPTILHSANSKVTYKILAKLKSSIPVDSFIVDLTDISGYGVSTGTLVETKGWIGGKINIVRTTWPLSISNSLAAISQAISELIDSLKSYISGR